MAVDIVVTDENGLPVRCTVAAIKTSDQSIITTAVTDSEGKVSIGASGTWYPRPMVAPAYKKRIKLTILNERHSPCYDYVVDASGGGTHLTLFGSGGALEAALTYTGTTAPDSSIWLCNDEIASATHTLTSQPSGTTQAVISIEAAGKRVTITTPDSANGLLLSDSASTANVLIRWRNINFFRTTGGTARPWGTFEDARGVSQEFDSCDWAGNFSAFTRVTVLGSRGPATTTLRDCTGTFTYAYQEDTPNAQDQGGPFTLHHCSITFTSGLFSTGSGIHAGTPEFVVEGDCVITSTGPTFITDVAFSGASLTLRNSRIVHTGAGDIISGAPDGDIHIENVVFVATQATSQAVVTSGGNPVYISGVLAINTAGSADPAVSISGRTLILGGLVQSGYASALSGTVSAGLDHGTLVGLADDDHVQYILKTLLSTTGDVMYASAANTPARLAIGTSSQVLGVSGGVPAWVAKAPLTTKGDLYTYDSGFQRLGVGTDGQVLSADSAEATGLKWIAAASGGGGGGLATLLADPTGATWTNMPAALTELLGGTNNRTKIDLTSATTVRLVVDVQTAGVAGAKLRAQYSTDESTWNYLDGATGPEVAVDATGTKASVVVNLAAGAKADVFLRVVGISGDGAADPVFGLIQLQFDAVSSGGGGGGAPTGAKYVTTLADAGLSAEVVRQQLGNYFAETYPASANAMDDEFDDTSGMSGAVNGLNARWTWRNQGTATASFGTQGWLTLNCPADAAVNWRIIEQTLPAGDWTFETKFGLTGDANNAEFAAVVLVDGVHGDLYALNLLYNSTTAYQGRLEVVRWNSVTVFNGVVLSTQAWGGTHVYARIKYTSASSTYEAFVSSDGISWLRMGSWVDAVVATKIGLATSEATNTGRTKANFDYFRRIA